MTPAAQVFARSRLHRKVEAALDQGVTCVSFDVFDTLLRRRFGAPHEVFSRVAEALAAEPEGFALTPDAYRQLRRQAETEAHRAAQGREIRHEDIFAHMPFDAATRQRLMACELRLERQALRADGPARSLYDLCRARGVRVIAISDMYLADAFVANMLRQNGYAPDALYVSSRHGVTKMSGQLFDLVAAAENLDVSNWLHIGDHPRADVLSAESRGLHALHFHLEAGALTALEREGGMAVDLDSRVRQARFDAALSCPAHDPDAAFFHTYGALFWGPLITAFASWLLERADKARLDLLVCHLREGALVAEALRHEQARRGGGGPRIVTAAASRQSTFWPSLADSTPEAVAAQLVRRRFYRVGDLAAEAGVDVTGWAADRELTTFAGDPAILKDLTARLQAAWPGLRTRMVAERERLRGYFMQLTDGAPRWASVEYSGSGTTQRQLDAALDRRADLNLLFFANPAAYEKATLMPVDSFLPMRPDTQKTIELITRCAEVTDSLLIGSEGSTTGYRVEGNGYVTAVRPDYAIPERQKTCMAALADGMAAYRACADALDAPALDPLTGAAILQRMVGWPTAEEARRIGALEHIDNYGESYAILPEAGVERIRAEGPAVFWRSFCANTDHARGTCLWPAGAVTLCDPHLISDLMLNRPSMRRFEAQITRLICALRDDGVAGIILYGAGEFALALLPELEAMGVRIVAVADARAANGAFRLGGHPVRTLAEIERAAGANIVIASASFAGEMRAAVAAAFAGVPHKIYSV